MSSLRRLTIPDLVADPALVERLIAEGETLFVEHKEKDPKNGLGPTVASFANMLGGWLLIGVDDDGKVVGYTPPGTADLQDYLRDLLRSQVDPLPPFAAISVSVDAQTIGVVRVAESSDTPHVASDGVIYQRTHGGKQRVTEARAILELARRGEAARLEAERTRLGLLLIEQAMATPSDIFADGVTYPSRRELPLLEWIVRASPYTVTGAFADRALSRAAAELATASVVSLFGGQAAMGLEARARGLYCSGARNGNMRHGDLAIDAGGAVAVRTAWRNQRDVLDLLSLPDNVLCTVISVAASLLSGLDGYGRAAFRLEVRRAETLTVQSGSGSAGTIPVESLLRGTTLVIGGDLAIPADDDDVRELADRWTRELARAARLPMWEPKPESTSEPDADDGARDVDESG